MNGIIIIDKPQGWTSFDVCNKIRHLTGIRKVGHSGTLDPMATGLLPVFLGSATKSVQHFISGEKGYIAEMTLGIRTDTLDATGKAITQPSPGYFQVNKLPSMRPLPKGEGLKVKEIFKKYVGKIKQKPPMFSAKKVNGKRLYKLARKGEVVEREEREVEIYKLELLEIKDDKIEFEVLCSKGTYIRVLAADIGDDLGCGAHLSALQRIYSHPFHISQAFDIKTIENLVKIGRLDTVILPVEEFITT
jgi:tRNA pseudouridine55 synthase